MIVDRCSDENDPILQEPAVNVITPLTSPGLLNHHRNEERSRRSINVVGMFLEPLNQLFTTSSGLISTLAFEVRKSRTLPISTSSRTCTIARFSSSSDIILSKLILY